MDDTFGFSNVSFAQHVAIELYMLFSCSVAASAAGFHMNVSWITTLQYLRDSQDTSVIKCSIAVRRAISVYLQRCVYPVASIKNTCDTESVCTHWFVDSNLANDRVCQNSGVALGRKDSKETDIQWGLEKTENQRCTKFDVSSAGCWKSTNRVPQCIQFNLTAPRKCTKFAVSSAGCWNIDRSSSSMRPVFSKHSKPVLISCGPVGRPWWFPVGRS